MKKLSKTEAELKKSVAYRKEARIVYYNNNREYLDITKLSKKVTYMQALTGIYIFTRNHYSP